MVLCTLLTGNCWAQEVEVPTPLPVSLAAAVHKFDCFEEPRDPTSCRVGVEIDVTPADRAPVTLTVACTTQVTFVDDYGAEVASVQAAKQVIVQMAGQTRLYLSIKATPAPRQAGYSNARVAAVTCQAKASDY